MFTPKALDGLLLSTTHYCFFNIFTSHTPHVEAMSSSKRWLSSYCDKGAAECCQFVNKGLTPADNSSSFLNNFKTK
jgi:hypothetical protein